MQIAGYQFRPDWKTSLLVALLLPLLWSLGLWQLDREREKQDILKVYQQRSAASPTSLNQTTAWQKLAQGSDAAFRRVLVRGKLQEAPLILLDNKTRNGVIGFQAVQAMDLMIREEQAGAQEDAALLSQLPRRVWLNRGWLAGGRLRTDLPQVDTPEQQVELIAHIYVPLGKPFVLANEFLSVAGKGPIIAQQIDMRELAAAFPETNTFPHLLRLEPESVAALSTDWPAVNTQPEKHRGYAIQWFAMAVALMLIYLLRSFEKPIATSQTK